MLRAEPTSSPRCSTQHLVDMESAQATPCLVSTRLCSAGKLCKRKHDHQRRRAAGASAGEAVNDGAVLPASSGNEQPALTGGPFRPGEIVMFCPFMHFSHPECLARSSLQTHARNYITTACPRCKETSQALRKFQLAEAGKKRPSARGEETFVRMLERMRIAKET